MIDRILAVLDAVPDLYPRLAEAITEDRAFRYLSALEAVPAPSQTVRWTRAPVVERLLRDDGVLDQPGVAWSRDFARSGNVVLRLGQQERAKRVWWLAHLDQISYLVEPGEGPTFPLMPLCYHMQREGRRPAVALGHDLAAGRLAELARGEIVIAGDEITFEVSGGDGPRLGPGTRVVYASRLEWDEATGRLTGCLDDTVACAALMLAAGVLCRYPVEVMIGLTDEEEGPPGDATQSFGRGGRRLVRWFEPPELAIVCDIHESVAMMHGPGPAGELRPGDGAVFAERSSRGRGTATPPHLYALQRALAAAFAERGILLRENWGGYVSRSEDVNAAIATPNVALIGYLGSNRHWAAGPPQANLRDLLHLAAVVVCYTLLAHSDLWRATMAVEP